MPIVTQDLPLPTHPPPQIKQISSLVHSPSIHLQSGQRPPGMWLEAVWSVQLFGAVCANNGRQCLSSKGHGVALVFLPKEA